MEILKVSLKVPTKVAMKVSLKAAMTVERRDDGLVDLTANL